MTQKKKKLNLIGLDGWIETTLGYEAWTLAFIDWLESRDEKYGGSTTELDEDGVPLSEPPPQ